jgi:hypothetical protein
MTDPRIELVGRGYDVIGERFAVRDRSRHLDGAGAPGSPGGAGRWFVRGGFLMTAFGTSNDEAWTGDWLGAPRFFSSFPPETKTRLVSDAGFEIGRDEVVTFREPEGDVTFQ